jgi:hypothetical protein
MLKTKKKKGEKKMKLASEKCFNRAICPVMNIKGQVVWVLRTGNRDL